MRVSQSQGMLVVDDSTQEAVGLLDQPLIDPDTGRITGFFIIPIASDDPELFLQSQDIVSWGTRVHVLSRDRLGPPHDFIRLKSCLEDPRSFLGQRMLIQGSRRSLGVLDDVQFDTRHFAVEWLFPRKFLFIRQPVPVAEIIEVTPEAIWIQDPIRPVREPSEDKTVVGLPAPELLTRETPIT